MSYRDAFVLKTELWVPTFIYDMYQPSIMFVAGDITQKLRLISYNIGKKICVCEEKSVPNIGVRFGCFPYFSDLTE